MTVHSEPVEGYCRRFDKLTANGLIVQATHVIEQQLYFLLFFFRAFRVFRGQKDFHPKVNRHIQAAWGKNIRSLRYLPELRLHVVLRSQTHTLCRTRQ